MRWIVAKVGGTVVDYQWAWTLDGVVCLSKLQSELHHYAGTEGDGLWLGQMMVDVQVRVSVDEPSEPAV